MKQRFKVTKEELEHLRDKSAAWMSKRDYNVLVRIVDHLEGESVEEWKPVAQGICHKHGRVMLHPDKCKMCRAPQPEEDTCSECGRTVEQHAMPHCKEYKLFHPQPIEEIEPTPIFNGMGKPNTMVAPTNTELADKLNELIKAHNAKQ